ncbi:MAG: hypothetical protein ACJAQ6_000072 [Arenicella sp.]|jgi:hypothetical protein
MPIHIGLSVAALAIEKFGSTLRRLTVIVKIDLVIDIA